MRLAARRLRSAPIFASAAVILLTVSALATGLALTVASRRSPPYPNSAEIVSVMAATSESCDVDCPDLVDADQFRVLLDQTRTLNGPVLVRTRGFLVGGVTDSYEAQGTLAESRLFQVLRVPARLGRTLTPGDDDPDSPPAVVLADRLWRRAFGSGSSVVGQSMPLGGRLFTIVGIMPPEFDYPAGSDLWITPVGLPSGSKDGLAPGVVLARLRPAISLEQARSELRVIARRSPRGTSGTPFSRRSLSVQRLIDEPRPDAPNLELVLGISALLLLMAFAALQTLGIVRSLEQRQAMAVRTALGAARWHVLSMAATDAAILGCIAITVALTLFAFVVGSSDRWLPVLGLNLQLELRPSTIALLILTVAGFAAGALLPPVALTLRKIRSTILQSTSGVGSPPIQAVALRKFAVATQLGLGLIFLTAATTLGRAIIHLQRTDLGYDRNGLLVAPLDLRDSPLEETSAGQAFAIEVVGTLSATPGIVTAAAWTVTSPSMMVKPQEPFATIEGGIKELRYYCRHPSDCSFPMLRYAVTETFFRTVGIPIVAGRPFTSADRRGTAPVAIISKQAALHWWPDKSPLGRRFKIGPPNSPYPWLTVVGVAANTQPIDEWGILHGAEHPGQFYPLIFQPLAQVELGPKGRPMWTSSLLVGVRHSATLPGPTTPIRAILQRLAPTIPSGRIASLADIQLENGLFQQIRLGALAASVLCGLALILTLVSIAALVAEAIRTRTKEFAIRLAVGATPSGLRRAASRDALVLTAAALAVTGGAATLLKHPLARVFYGATKHYPDGILYGAEPHFILSLVTTGVVLALFVAVSAWLCTRVLDKLEPVALLRQD